MNLKSIISHEMTTCMAHQFREFLVALKSLKHISRYENFFKKILLSNYTRIVDKLSSKNFKKISRDFS